MTANRQQPGLLTDEAVLHRIAADLSAKYAGIFAAETVERYVFESYASLARTSKVTAHLPVITERFARDRLNALARAKGAIAHDVPEVLFVCVQNAGRSQMAAALLARRAAGKVHVLSAGSLPAERIDPEVIQAMTEAGCDLSAEFPKPLTDDVVRAADVVITMGCGDSCPIYPGKTYQDWQVRDPSGEPLETVRRIREDLDNRVSELLNALGITGT